MAVMSEEQRKAVWAKFMSLLSSRWEPLGAMTKQELRVVIDDIDAGVASGAADFETVWSGPFKSNATAKQKAELLQLVRDARTAAGV